MRAKSLGSSGRISVTDGGVFRRIAGTNSAEELPSRGRRPVAISCSNTPTEKISVRWSGGHLVGPTVTPAIAAAKPSQPAKTTTTATPIRHLVVIFNENISFDHYFGTYPNATNPKGDWQGLA
jgi:Phosphoesterase family